MVLIQKKWPTEQWDFRDIITGDYHYIDRTAEMWRLANQSQLVFLARPRRFGKSLLTTTFQYYFLAEKDLFKGLKAEQLQAESGKPWESYPTLRFDMSLSSSTVEELQIYLADSLQAYEKEYGITYSHDPMLVGSRFASLIRKLYEQTGRQVVVLIDEYDAPLGRTLGRGQEEEHEAFKALLRSFYSVLKGALTMLRFVLLTGVSQFRQVSIFSGLNNINDITFDPAYDTICGIGEQELHDQFDWRVEEFASKLRVDKDRIYRELRERYDGFRFTQAETHVYNPFSLIRSLSKMDLGNYWFDSGTTSIVASILPSYWYDFRRLNGPIEAHSSDLKRFVPDEVNPVPLLFQTGYLTIESYDAFTQTYTLRFPNEPIKWAFWRGALPDALGKGNDASYRQELDAMVEHIRAGRVDDLMDSLQFLLSTVPYTLKYHNQPTREAQFQMALFFVFKLAGRDVRAEIPSARGRSDIEIHTDTTIYILELKLHKPPRPDEEPSGPPTPDDAIAQIREKGYDQPYRQSGKRIVLIGMAFNGQTQQFTWKAEG